MENVIHTIFLGKADENVHEDFVKFSRGVFQDRYLIEGKKQKDKWSIKTSNEFANFFVRRCLNKVSGEVNVSGTIITTINLSSDIDFEISDTKKYMGIKQLLINTKISPLKIIKLMEKYPRAFFALSFAGDNFELKIKAKPPKSGKPGTKGEDGPKADFCSLKTNDKELVEDLFFDFPNFQEIKIKHILEIKEIEIPQGISDPKELREKAKRKGVIKRIIKIDGREEIKEKQFVA